MERNSLYGVLLGKVLWKIREPAYLPGGEIVEQLRRLERYYASIGDDFLLCPECIATVDHLLEYHCDFQIKYLEYARRLRKKIRRTVSYERHDNRVYDHPRLIIDGKPVLDLFLYNIRRHVTAKKLREFLSAYGFDDVEIVKLHRQKCATSASLRCKSLSTSCRIQVKSCLRKLIWNYTNGSSNVISVKPSIREGEPDLAPYVTSPRHRSPFERQFEALISCGDVMDSVARYLNAEEFFGLYEACHRAATLAGLTVEFDSTIDRYAGGTAHQIMFDDAQLFKFRSIVFGKTGESTNSAVVDRVLRIQANRQPAIVIPLSEVDLTGVEISPEIITLLSECFEVRSLRLGPVRDIFDQKLKIYGLEHLRVRDNNCYRAHYLLSEHFQYLSTFHLHSCKKLFINGIYNFVFANRRLKTLSIEDCGFIDKGEHVIAIFVAVFSGENVLREFNFSYGDDQDPLTDEYDRSPQINGSSTLEVLRLRNNKYTERVIENIVLRSPNIKDIDLTGARLPSNFRY